MIEPRAPSLNTFLKVVVGYFLLVTFFYIYFRPAINNTLTHIFYLITFLLGSWAAWLNIKAFGIAHPQGKAFLMVFAAFFSGTIGQSIWSVQQALYNPGSPPTSLYLFLALGYVFGLTGFVMEIRALNIDWTHKRLFESKIIALAAVILGLLIYKLEIFPVLQGNFTAAVRLVTVINGLGDIVGLALGATILRLAIEYRGGLLFRPWLSICTGQALILIADLIFAVYGTGYLNGLSGNLTKLLWLAANLFVAYGFYGIGDAIRTGQKDLADQGKSV
jgi:hypothetical protein